MFSNKMALHSQGEQRNRAFFWNYGPDDSLFYFEQQRACLPACLLHNVTNIGFRMVCSILEVTGHFKGCRSLAHAPTPILWKYK
jgi:hypothetical protein